MGAYCCCVATISRSFGRLRPFKLPFRFFFRWLKQLKLAVPFLVEVGVVRALELPSLAPSCFFLLVLVEVEYLGVAVVVICCMLVLTCGVFERPALLLLLILIVVFFFSDHGRLRARYFAQFSFEIA